MGLRFFAVPVRDSSACEQELNRFLSGHKVVSIERHLIDQGVNSFWAICVDYLSHSPGEAAFNPNLSRSRVDYKTILTPEDFAVFSLDPDQPRKVVLGGGSARRRDGEDAAGGGAVNAGPGNAPTHQIWIDWLAATIPPEVCQNFTLLSSITLRLILLGGFVDLLPRQWATLSTTDAKHANGVAIDHEGHAVDVWTLAREDLIALRKMKCSDIGFLFASSRDVGTYLQQPVVRHTSAGRAAGAPGGPVLVRSRSTPG